MVTVIPAGKVLKNTRNLLGKPRVAGEFLTPAEVKEIPPHVAKALVNGGKIELFTHTSKADEALLTRVEILEAQVHDLLYGVKEQVSKPAPKRRGRPRKDS